MSSSRYLQHARQFHASLRRTRTIAHELKPINRKRIGRDRHFKSAHQRHNPLLCTSRPRKGTKGNENEREKPQSHSLLKVLEDFPWFIPIQPI
ncbi:hypothetical protein VTJ04DRAFT_830 [Mycothermus thermophilus]|uniref:uncharacterized protein n=1 Tax=Humicola insolens TaxID=85995 RepID=UPI0037424103